MDRKITGKSKFSQLTVGVALCILLVIALTVYDVSQSNSTGKHYKVNLDNLTISTANQGTFVDALSLRGQVVPKSTIYLDTSAGGQVEQRLVQQGEFVEKGQPLVRLSNTNLQLDVMSREAQVTEQLNFLRNTQMNMETNRLDLSRDLLEIELKIKHLQRRLNQTASLVLKGLQAKDKLAEINDDLTYFLARKKLSIERQKQQNSIRKVQIKQLKDSAKMLEKNLQFARNNLDNLLIKAPVSGYLSELAVEIGESKSRGARLGQIDIPNEYKLVVRLDEFYLNQIQTGMTVSVKRADATILASVSKIDSRVNQSQFLIEVDLPSTIRGIKRGQSIDVDLMLSGANTDAILLNRGAFFTSSGGHWAFVVAKQGDIATRRDIRLGKKNQHYFEVLSGLTAGEQVVTSSYNNFDQAQQLNFQ